MNENVAEDTLAVIRLEVLVVAKRKLEHCLGNCTVWEGKWWSLVAPVR